MKPTLAEDVTSILAIACSAGVGVGLTAALLLPPPEAPVRLIPDTHRAVVVNVANSAQLEGRLGRGARVAVTVVQDHQESTATTLVVPDAEVLGRPQVFAARSRTGQQESINVVVLVSAEEAAELAPTMDNGRVHLSILRDAPRSLRLFGGAEPVRVGAPRHRDVILRPMPAPPAPEGRSGDAADGT